MSSFPTTLRHSSASPFEALGEDLILIVLSLCDAYTVLSVSATNKPLRQIALAKQLWLSLVHALIFQGVLDLAPHDHEQLDGRSTAELIELVKRGVLRVPPEPSSRATLQHQLHDDAGATGRVIDWLLLPGARYAVVQKWEEVRIYDVWSGRSVWKQAISLYTTWAIDLLPGGAIAHFLLREFAASPYYNTSVQEIDLATGLSRQLLSGYHVHYESGMQSKIVGDYILLTLPPTTPGQPVALINWRTATYVVLNYGLRAYLPEQSVLIPGYILVTYRDNTPPHELLLTVTEISSLSTHWKPLQEFSLSNPLPSTDIRTLVHIKLEYNGRPLGDTDVYLSALPSALHRDGHDIVVFVEQTEGPRPSRIPLSSPMRHVAASTATTLPLAPADHRGLISYRLISSDPPGGLCGWRLVSAVPVTCPAEMLLTNDWNMCCRDAAY
ncbi:hypothetical protein B0H13DRAFT_2379595 [Mycena leptocephala]|nr:hypothetical protein B0H13DRAFT_2379595 [Mycena leptocephala]